MISKKPKVVTIKHPKRMTTKITQDNKQPKQKIMQPNTLKSKNNGCGTAPGNLVLTNYPSPSTNKK